jgi:hypothetical protein
MSFEARCPQCLFISSQFAQRTPCLLHVSLSFDAQVSTTVSPFESSASVETVQAEYDEPYDFGKLRPTVDRPGPFTVREYVRLQLLRTRIQAEPSALDARLPRVEAHSLSPR